MCLRKVYDAIIIGGGVVGSSVARELARYHIKVCVLEKEADVCCGNSSRNTGVLHAGFLYKTGSLQAKFAVEGNAAFEQISKELDVPYKRTGKLTIGFTEGERERLLKLKSQGDCNGVPNLSIIGRDEIKQVDPNVEAEFALYSPTSGIMCPYMYTIALAENAKLNGVDYYFENEVCSVKKEKDGAFSVSTAKGRLYSRWIINSAGLGAPTVAAMLGSAGYAYKPVKGEYILLDKRAIEQIRVPVYPAPDEKGVTDLHATPTIDGNVLMGPTCNDVVQSCDLDTTADSLDYIVKKGASIFKGMKTEWIIRSFSGIMPRFVERGTSGYLDFLIEHRPDNPNVVNLLGMDSPALTGAYPIGKYVADIVAAQEKLAKNNSFDPCRKGIKKFSEQDVETRCEMIEQNPDYGEIVCRCEYVTKAEIVEALNNPLGVTSVNGIKYRTRATMGRCQGGYCETRIASIIQESKGLDRKDIRLDNSRSYMFTGEVRESCGCSTKTPSL